MLVSLFLHKSGRFFDLTLDAHFTLLFAPRADIKTSAGHNRSTSAGRALLVRGDPTITSVGRSVLGGTGSTNGQIVVRRGLRVALRQDRVCLALREAPWVAQAWASVLLAPSVNGRASRQFPSLDGNGTPRFCRSIAPSYSVRNRPRRCNSGTTRSTNSLSAPGTCGGNRLKPSAAFSTNHCSSWSAIVCGRADQGPMILGDRRPHRDLPQASDFRGAPAGRSSAACSCARRCPGCPASARRAHSPTDRRRRASGPAATPRPGSGSARSAASNLSSASCCERPMYIATPGMTLRSSGCRPCCCIRPFTSA